MESIENQLYYPVWKTKKVKIPYSFLGKFIKFVPNIPLEVSRHLRQKHSDNWGPEKGPGPRSGSLGTRSPDPTCGPLRLHVSAVAMCREGLASQRFQVSGIVWDCRTPEGVRHRVSIGTPHKSIICHARFICNKLEKNIAFPGVSTTHLCV